MDKHIVNLDNYKEWDHTIVICKDPGTGKKIIAKLWFTGISYELRNTIHVIDKMDKIVCTTNHLALAQRIYNNLT